uniref:Porin n=1 Tax=Desulfacinum infernum TaxID=35837 RepID=A0A832A102_9BACT
MTRSFRRCGRNNHGTTGLRVGIVSVACAAALLAVPHSGSGSEAPRPSSDAQAALDTLFTWCRERTDVHGEILTYGVGQRARHGAQNPHNLILDVPRAIGAVEARPDGSFRWSRLEAAVKPRWRAQESYWDSGRTPQGWDGDTDFFVNEWWVRLEAVQGLFVSYGRENLQWGPAYFLSPTNAFFRDNGRSNPKDEVDGMDFFRITWIPSASWTVSVMVNTDEGRQEWMRDFEQTYAVKVDWTGYRRYASFIASKRADRRWHWGGYAGMTASEALLLYTEVDMSLGSPALYPEQDPASPFGVVLTDSRRAEKRLNPLILVGGAYTLASGPTLVAEYVYHHAGYDEREADRFFHVIQAAGAAFGQPSPVGAAAAATLAQSLDPGLRLLRRDYLMLQYQHMDWWKTLDVVLRTTFNVDDGSVRLNPIVEYDFGDRMKGFVVGAQTVGSDWAGLRSRTHPNRTEFRRIGDYSFWVGLEFFF